MTPPQHPPSAPDGAPSEALRSAIAALPTERTLPADSWEQLQQAMQATPRVDAPDRRQQHTRASRRLLAAAMLGMAALLALVLATAIVPARNSPRAETASLLLPEERSDPRVRAVLDETRNWRAASTDPVRSIRWPRAAREAIESALVATDSALASARLALRADPDDAAARDAIAVLRATQLLLLQRAMTLLDEI